MRTNYCTMSRASSFCLLAGRRINCNASSSNENASYGFKLWPSHANNSQVAINIRCVHGMIIGIKHFLGHGTMQHAHQGRNVLRYFGTPLWLQDMILRGNDHACSLSNFIRALYRKGSSGIKMNSIFCQVPQCNVGKFSLKTRSLHLLYQFTQSKVWLRTAT